MFSFRSSVSLPRCTSYYLCSHSSHFHPKCSNVNICKTVISSSESYSVNFAFAKQKESPNPLKVVASACTFGRQVRLGLPSRYRKMSLRFPIPTHERVSRVSWDVKRAFSTFRGTSVGVCLSFSSAGLVYAEAPMSNNKDIDGGSAVGISHGKKVYTDYSITGIPGDGRCLFRSVAHGACIRSGKPLPDEALQRELADVLRARVADEFVKRRAETEWFVEGDFDAYISQIRKPHVWGGEPELFMASHVLQMPITVYMHDEDAGGLIAIAEYGQEYGKDDPVRVLYHGFGHYDSLQVHGTKGSKSRL